MPLPPGCTAAPSRGQRHAFGDGSGGVGRRPAGGRAMVLHHRARGGFTETVRDDVPGVHTRVARLRPCRRRRRRHRICVNDQSRRRTRALHYIRSWCRLIAEKRRESVVSNGIRLI